MSACCCFWTAEKCITEVVWACERGERRERREWFLSFEMEVGDARSKVQEERTMPREKSEGLGEGMGMIHLAEKSCQKRSVKVFMRCCFGDWLEGNGFDWDRMAG